MKKFKKWTKMKSVIEKYRNRLYGNPRDIFWASIGTNIGKEICGHGDGWDRPVLILRRTGSIYTVLPMTTKGLYKDGNIWLVKEGHHRVTSVRFGFDSFIVMNQIKTIDGKRFKSKVVDKNGNDAMMSVQEFFVIKNKIRKNFK